MLKHVLVPLDGSELAERALEHAQQITAQGGEITLLSAVDSPEYMAYNMYGTQTVPSQVAMPRSDLNFQALAEEMMSQSKQYLNRIAADLNRAGYQASVRVERGAPADVIIHCAAELKPSAIVISTHGRSGLTRWILGSVTQKVLSAAPCPVFVIPPPPPG